MHGVNRSVETGSIIAAITADRISILAAHYYTFKVYYSAHVIHEFHSDAYPVHWLCLFISQ